MVVLHNRVNGEELKQQMLQETEKRITLSFYRYFEIQNPLEFRNFLYQQLSELQVFGRIYVAKEGINAQVSVPQPQFDACKQFLASVEGLQHLRLNIAVDDDGKSFWVLKVKVRDKIVADGIADAAFSMNKKGRYVNAAQMNEFMNRPGTVVVDMRNHYEFEVGHFQDAS